MFGHKKTNAEEVDRPERLHYTKYYEHDGALRAYANRAMVLACSMSLLAFLSLAFAIYVRMQPPTIIRVSADGESTVLSGRPLFRKQVPGTLVDPRQSPQPQSYEKEAFIRQFLDHYLNYDVHNVSLQWASALNSMSSNLKSSALRVMQKENTVGRIEDENTRSVFHLRGIEATKEDPMLYTAYGVRELHRMDGDREVIETTVNQYRVRLADQNRSAENPSGLLVGEYSEKQIDGEKKAALLAADSEGYRMLRQQP
ncbi:MAG TPA: hypothetical protein VF783_26690 [Terriglobales bacterium]